MNIVIDVTGALGNASGIRRYTEELLKGLAEIDHSNRYVLYAAFWNDFPGRMLSLRMPSAPNFSFKPTRLPQKWVLKAERSLKLRVHERLLLETAPDVLHGVCNTLPRLSRIPSVVTIHHVGGLDERSSRWKEFYFWDLVRDSARSAQRVIADSEYTRRRAIERFQLDPIKIKTVWLGGPSADSAFRNDAAPKPAVAGPYLLFVSALNKRKNLVRLLQAFARLRGKGRPHHLVLAGSKEDAYPEIVDEAGRLGLSEAVFFLENLDDSSLNSLYRHADLFVYPSLLEGFGLPLLEAMTTGCPVVASNAASIPEILGDAGLLFDPENVEDMADKINQVLDRPDLRLSLVQKGLNRARAFNWEHTARKTLEIYREAYASPAE